MTSTKAKAAATTLALDEVPMRPLGRCGKIFGGGTPSKSNAEFWKGTIPWITAKEMWTDEIRDSQLKISEAALKESPAKLIPANSVLFVVRGSILFKRVPVAVNRVVCTINQDMKAIVPDDDILADYLALMMRATNDELKSRVGIAGNSAGKLETDEWSSVEIPVPPLAEQRRVVARVEVLMSRAQELRNLNASLVEDATRLLTAEYNRITDDAPTRPFGGVAKLVRRRVRTQPDESYAELGIRSFGKGTFHKHALTGRQLGNKRIFRILPGDLVFMNVFAWEGAIAVAKPEDEGRVGSHRFMTYEILPEHATPEFLCHHFLTDYGLEQIRAASPGSAGRNRTLGITKVHAVRVPVPPVETQHRFSKLHAIRERLHRLQIETEAELVAFTPALLGKAFRGEL
jgi:type I restriction enzyme S subunit